MVWAADASTFACVGETLSSDLGAWQSVALTTKMTCDVEMPAYIAPGTRVWMAAYFDNAKAEASPMSQPAVRMLASV